MMRWAVYATLLLGIGFVPASRPASLKTDMTFLTRDGCVNTDRMRANLDAALKALHLPLDYSFVDIGTLKNDDPRTGYPTPTILYKNKDLFGMSQPTPPYPEPT